MLVKAEDHILRRFTGAPFVTVVYQFRDIVTEVILTKAGRTRTVPRNYRMQILYIRI